MKKLDSYKKKIVGLSIFSIISTFAGLVIGSPERIGICLRPYGSIDGRHCSVPEMQQTFGAFIFLLGLVALIVAGILYFRHEASFTAWRNFSIVYIPLSLLIFFVLYDPSDWIASPGVVAVLLSGLYLIISVLIVILKKPSKG